MATTAYSNMYAYYDVIPLFPLFPACESQLVRDAPCMQEHCKEKNEDNDHYKEI